MKASFPVHAAPRASLLSAERISLADQSGEGWGVCCLCIDSMSTMHWHAVSVHTTIDPTLPLPISFSCCHSALQAWSP